MEELPHVRLPGGDAGAPLRVLQLTDLHLLPPGCTEMRLPPGCRGAPAVPLGAGTEYTAGLDVSVVRAAVARARPDVVVLTGDIVDARAFAGRERGAWREPFAEVVRALSGTPWTYIPGNHDDDGGPWQRGDLAGVYTLPGCVSAAARGFDHTLTVGRSARAGAGSLRLWLLDYGANASPPLRYQPPAPAAVAALRCAAAAERQLPAAERPGRGLCFVHIPLPEQARRPIAGRNHVFEAALAQGIVPFPWRHVPWFVRAIGKNWVGGWSARNTGLFAALRDSGVLAVFCGHDHQSDAVTFREGVFMAWGRCGSTTPPRDWQGSAAGWTPAPGARVIEYDPGSGAVQTWVETADGEEAGSRLLLDAGAAARDQRRRRLRGALCALAAAACAVGAALLASSS